MMRSTCTRFEHYYVLHCAVNIEDIFPSISELAVMGSRYQPIPMFSIDKTRTCEKDRERRGVYLKMLNNIKLKTTNFRLHQGKSNYRNFMVLVVVVCF